MEQKEIAKRADIQKTIVKTLEEMKFSLFELNADYKKNGLNFKIKIENIQALAYYFNWQGGKLSDITEFLQKLPGVKINDCEAVSKKINDNLKQVCPELNYTLEVSSPGMFRQVRNLFEWIIFRNFLVKIKLNYATPAGGDRGFLIDFYFANEKIVQSEKMTIPRLGPMKEKPFFSLISPNLTWDWYLDYLQGKPEDILKIFHCFWKDFSAENRSLEYESLSLKAGEKEEFAEKEKPYLVFLRYPIDTGWNNFDDKLIQFVKIFWENKGKFQLQKSNLRQARRLDMLRDLFAGECLSNLKKNYSGKLYKKSKRLNWDLIYLNEIKDIRLEFIF